MENCSRNASGCLRGLPCEQILPKTLSPPSQQLDLSDWRSCNELLCVGVITGVFNGGVLKVPPKETPHIPASTPGTLLYVWAQL